MGNLDKVKNQYNKLLKRFENGCVYLGNHKDEIPKYLPELVRITKDLSTIIDIMANNGHIMTDNEINYGFKN